MCHQGIEHGNNVGGVFNGALLADNAVHHLLAAMMNLQKLPIGGVKEAMKRHRLQEADGDKPVPEADRSLADRPFVRRKPTKKMKRLLDRFCPEAIEKLKEEAREQLGDDEKSQEIHVLDLVAYIDPGTVGGLVVRDYTNQGSEQRM